MYELKIIAAALRALPPKPRAPSMRDGVMVIAPEINDAISKAYSIEDVCKLLAEHGMTIKPSTLRAYLRALTPKTVARAASRAGAKPRRKTLKPNKPDKSVEAAPPVGRGVVRSAEDV